MECEPYYHRKDQDDFLIRCYKANNYLEDFHLTFFNIPNQKEHLKQLLLNEDLIFLKHCAMNRQLKGKLDTALQECIASKSYINVEHFLNFDLYDEDVETFVVPLLKRYTDSTVLFDKTVFSNQFIDIIKDVCQPMIQKNAESVVMSGKYQQYLEKIQSKSEGQCTDYKAQRSKQAVQDYDSDDATHSENNAIHLDIISIEDVETTIKKKYNKKTNKTKRHLNQTALTIAKEFFEKLFQDAQHRKITHYSVQNRINVLMNDITLYERGLKLFLSDQQPQFEEYLLKSFGGDVLSVDQRNKLINDLSEEYLKPLHILSSVLAEHNMEEFYQAVDVCLFELGMTLKKINKKKERLLIDNHKEELLSHINNCEEPVLVLHLVVLVLFTIVTQNMLHASGRQVPIIILFLKSKLKENDFDKIQKYHETVAKYLIAADEEKESLEEKLKEDLPFLKSIVTDVKKCSKIIEPE